jgi:hypothetical protein
VMATYLLEVPYHADPVLWLTGTGVGAALVTLSGWLATRGALVQPPMTILRQG